MFSIFKSKKQETKSAKVEAISKKELTNVIGGGEPVIGVDVSIDQVPGGLQMKKGRI